jgi:hypothetical protein
LEIGRVRHCVGLWRLRLETGRWRGDLSANRMTGFGREANVNEPFWVDARPAHRV